MEGQRRYLYLALVSAPVLRAEGICCQCSEAVVLTPLDEVYEGLHAMPVPLCMSSAAQGQMDGWEAAGGVVGLP